MRDHLQWSPGTRLTLEQTDGGVILRAQATQFAPTKPDEVFGSLSYRGEPKSIEAMDAGIAAEAHRRDARSRY